MNLGFIILFAVLVVLLAIAIVKRLAFEPVLKRLIEQFAKLVPRMLCALVAAGFVAQLIPAQAISRLLGPEAGLFALPIAAAVALIVPAGPVIAFAIAAVFAKSGASTPALMTFITSWSLYATHRIVIYEIPLMGVSFLRLRGVSVLILPFVIGVFATLAGMLVSYGTAVPRP